MTTKAQPTVVPCHDFNRRTCIQVERVAGLVKFIPLDIIMGLEVHSTSADSFDQRFTPMKGYPVEKACQLFVNYSQTLGATKEAMDYLGQVVNVSKQELKMATEKKQVKAEKPAKTVEKKPSAAQMFQDLIMAGKLTDDQIFEKVQTEFGLDEKKRGYVKWYRNHLKKQGQNPPEAKLEK